VTEIPRRTVDELGFIYEQHPELRDVYVEGPFDASILTWFLNECSLAEVAVYPIASIEIPDGDILAAGRTANNRERLVQLSAFLRTSPASHALCVVDADFAILRGEQLPLPPLFQTDYSCMEMYFFDISNMRKFLTLYCQRPNWSVTTIMNSLVSVLQEFFLYRYANDELAWEMDWLDKNACLKLSGSRIDLDTDGFVTRFLNKNARAGDRQAFLEKVEDLREDITANPRHQMHGHDLTSLLGWYLRKRGLTGRRSQAENILSCMVMTLDAGELKTTFLFQGILAHLN
jgi:hypothetical protein